MIKLNNKKKSKRKPYSDDNYEAELKKFVISGLRRVSLWWPARSMALKAARIKRGIYKCAHCRKEFAKKEIQLDHKYPVVRISGFTDYNDYIKRMLPPSTHYDVLCKSCHSLKTQEENILRNLKKKVDKATS